MNSLNLLCGKHCVICLQHFLIIIPPQNPKVDLGRDKYQIVRIKPKTCYKFDCFPINFDKFELKSCERKLMNYFIDFSQ